MERLFTIDLKDYDANGTHVYRPSVRAVILAEDGKIALVHSKKHHYYKFPGGGIEEGESHMEALIREVKEEVGLSVIPDSIKEFGNVLRLQKGNEGANIIFEQENFYYTCKVEKTVGNQNLDIYEEEAQFELKIVTLDEAIKENVAYKCDDLFAQLMIDRDRRVLELISDSRKAVMSSSKVYFHVVTERPMSVGQHIVFDDTHHSGVYSRVMNKRNVVDEIYSNPENFLDDDLEHHTRVALRELAMEEVRRKKYPDFPSRMSSLYVSKTLEEANKWFDFFKELGRPTHQIVKVEVNGGVFEGNANRCFDGCKDRKYNMKMAEEYWSNDAKSDANNNPVVEVLVDGDIVVLEIVRGEAV